MSVCACVFVRVCVLACVLGCMFFLVRECVYVRACMRTCVCVCAWVCMYVSVCVYVRVCGYACVCVRVSTCGGREGIIRLYSWNVFHVYIMTINYCQIWKVLALVDQLCGKIVPVSLAKLP